MSNDSPAAYDQYELDPVFLNSRKEALAVFLTWVVALLWAVPVCYFMGFRTGIDSTNVSMVMGIPTWVFWGIAFPWLVADVVTTWMCFKVIKNDDLGIAADELDAETFAPIVSQGASK
ncbi:MAG: DUF997 domain-containing protein [Planctomycetota bacterium]|nr:DUF997 domain-containing protein [Planctomycetota bacterium]